MANNFQYEYFINCSLSASLCEVQPFFMGSGVGICNQETQLCECPLGFNGEDVWAIFNDCHINLSVITGMEITLAVFAFIGVGFSVFSLIVILIRWQVLRWPNNNTLSSNHRGSSSGLPLTVQSPQLTVLSPQLMQQDSNSPTVEEDPISPRFTLSKPHMSSLLPKVDLSEVVISSRRRNTNAFQQVEAEKRRKFNTLAIIILWLLYFVCLVIFMMYRVVVKRRIEQADWLQLMALAIAISCTILGLWLATYAWFVNLPSLRLFAGMFPNIRNNLLVKHPVILRNFIVINGVFVIIFGAVVFWLLPVFFNMNTRELSQFMGTFLGVEVFVYMITSNAVSLILIKLFAASGKSPSGASFAKGDRTVKSMLILTSLAGPFFSVWSLVFAWNAGSFPFAYLFVVGWLVAGAGAGFVQTYVFVFRMGSRTANALNTNVPRRTSLKS